MMSRILTDQIQQEIHDLGEYSYGAYRVVVTLDDGTEIPDVYVAWAKEVVKVGDSEEIPFDASRVVKVRLQS